LHLRFWERAVLVARFPASQLPIHTFIFFYLFLPVAEQNVVKVIQCKKQPHITHHKAYPAIFVWHEEEKGKQTTG
jgi:hypothetical protein